MMEIDFYHILRPSRCKNINENPQRPGGVGFSFNACHSHSPPARPLNPHYPGVLISHLSAGPARPPSDDILLYAAKVWNVNSERIELNDSPGNQISTSSEFSSPGATSAGAGIRGSIVTFYVLDGLLAGRLWVCSQPMIVWWEGFSSCHRRRFALLLAISASYQYCGHLYDSL